MRSASWRIGQRRLELRGGAEACGNAGDHRIGDAGGAQRFDLLAAAAEDEGIAALQPHRALAGFRRLDQQLVDRILADAGLADAAADRNARGVAADAIENFGRHQFVVENDVGVLQRAQRLDGEQIRIARPGADQRHPALGLAVLARAGEGGRIGDFVQRLFGLVLAAGEHQRADRAIDHALPEAAAQREFGNARMHRFAKAADEAGEIADARRQHRFDALAHAARHHRRGAAGADGNDDVAAIDDRGKDESGMREVVHHIDGQPDRLRARRHRNADIAGAGAEDRDHAGEIGRQRIALRQARSARRRRHRGLPDHDRRRSHTSGPARRPPPAGAISRARVRPLQRAAPCRFADPGTQADSASDTRFPQLGG